MHRRILLAVVAVAAVVAVPSTAHGSTLERLGGISQTLHVTGGPDETNLISVDDSPFSVVIRDDGAPLKLKRALGCKRIDERSARCLLVKRVALDLNVGPDVANIASSREVWLDGGAGDDRYIARGTDAPSRVDFSGGSGFDVANYFFATEGVRVGVDGLPGDGRPGDDDRIGRTVEGVFGSEFTDTLTGAGGEQHLLGFDGDDEISGGPGTDELFGGRGNDRVDARDGELDTIDCGAQLLDRVTADAVETSILGCADVLVG
jgi:Ca2+-binding RTX toxin-like protein